MGTISAAVLRPTTHSRRLMWRFLSTQRWRITGAVMAGVFTILSSVALLATSAWLIERASQRPPILSLMVAIVAVRFFGIGRGVFRWVDRYLSHDASFRLLGAMRSDVYRSLIPLAPAGLQELGHGDVMSRVAADVDSMQEWFVRGFAPLCISLITLVVVSVGATIILLPAGAVLFLTLVVAAIVLAFATRSRNWVAHDEVTLRGEVTASMIAYLQGLPDLVAMGSAEIVAAQLEDTERARDRLAEHRARRSAIAIGIQASLPTLLAALLGLVAIAQLPAGLNPLTVGVLVFGGMAAAECVAAIPGAVESWERGLAASRRLAEIEERPLPVPVHGSAHLDHAPSRLAVRGVSFAYPGSSHSILDGVSFEIAVGQRMVIVGPSGVGKTTLSALLLRLLEPAGGTITLDGVDLSALDEGSIRHSVGAATQHAHLFAGSIRDNILLARPDAKDDELRAVIESAQLTRWVSSLPDGWNTEVGERGVAVSGGQRRRIALARALLAGFPFLIADEPTEGLDEQTAREVMETLFAAARDHALLVITHRPDLCPPAEMVYALDEGRLVRTETGVSQLAPRRR